MISTISEHTRLVKHMRDRRMGWFGTAPALVLAGAKLAALLQVRWTQQFRCCHLNAGFRGSSWESNQDAFTVAWKSCTCHLQTVAMKVEGLTKLGTLGRDLTTQPTTCWSVPVSGTAKGSGPANPWVSTLTAFQMNPNVLNMQLCTFGHPQDRNAQIFSR